jgi:hypothetical protein
MLIEMLSFVAPKLSAVGVGYMSDSTFAARLERAIARSNSARLGDAARCVVCLKIMDRLDKTNVKSFKLIHRPEDA